MVLVHPEESIKFLIYDLHYVFGDNLALEVLKERLRLRLRLIRTEVVLLLQLVPDLQLIHEVREQAIHLVQPRRQVGLLENFLDLVARDGQQEFVGVDVLREGQTGKEHVHETLHGVEVEVPLQEFQIGDELLILRHLETLEVLLLQELEDNGLLGV